MMIMEQRSYVRKLGDLGATFSCLMVLWGLIMQFFPECLANKLRRWQKKLRIYVFPHMSIQFEEFSRGLHKRNKAYTAIEFYLSSKTTAKGVSMLKAEWSGEKVPMLFKLADYEDVEDEFQGVKFKWYRGKHSLQNKMIFMHSAAPQEEKYYTLSFHPKHWGFVKERYLAHVLNEGKAIKKKMRQKMIYMNSPDDYGTWDSIKLEHPANLDSFAMDPDKKMEIMRDLIAFKEGKEYYAKIGKAWKRGYLLYGPPGTGKSTMIVAMANLLDYDIYDLELTTVKDNAQLKALLIDVSPRAIIVVEDIDCSLDLTGKRKTQNDEADSYSDVEDEEEKFNRSRGKDKSKVTLSGFLNFVDGIWSACGGERIIVFTTNHIGKLDPALIRKGRMDMHIELSYCTFEGFKVLAKNYLDIDSHPLFEKIKGLLEEVNITPADVAERLIQSRVGGDPTCCLESLITALETAKQEKANKDEEETAKKGKEAEGAKQKEDSKKIFLAQKIVKRLDRVFTSKTGKAK